MKKIKVIEYIISLADGGAESLIKNYALLLNPEIFNVKIFVQRKMPETANSRILKEKGIVVDYIYPKWNLFWHVIDKLFGKIYIKHRTKKYLLKEKPDVLHMHLQVLNTIPQSKKCIGDTFLLYTCHSIPERYFSGVNVQEYTAAKKLIANYNLQMVALQPDMKKEIDKLFSIDNTIVLRNGIDISKFINARTYKQEMRKVLGIPQQSFVLGHVGRFVDIKNHSFILKVFVYLRSIRPDSYIIFIGDGPLRNDIEKEASAHNISDRLLFLEHRTDVNKIMGAMDAFIFPSIFEGLGIALIEAQAAGLRCIASNKVPSDAFITPNAEALDLNDPVEKWTSKILEPPIPLKKEWFAKYDIITEMTDIESLYGRL